MTEGNYKEGNEQHRKVDGLLRLVKDLAQNTLGIQLNINSSDDELDAIAHELNAFSELWDIRTLKNRYINELLNCAPDGIVAVNDKREIILFNKQAEEIFGYKTEEVIGEKLETLMPSEFQSVHEGLVRGFFSHPANRPMGGAKTILSGKRKDGEEFPIDISLNFIQTNKGKIAVSSIKDITERRLSEEKIRQSEANLKAVFESSSESMLLLDTSGIILTFNANAQKTNGLTCETDLLAGRNFLDYIVDSRKELVSGMISKVVRGESIEYTQAFYDFNGGLHCFDFSIYPVKKDGQITGICLNGRNMTEHRLAENRILRANRLYAFISQINKTIVQVEDEDTLFNEACRIATEIGKFDLVWISIPDVINKKVNVVAHSNALESDLELLRNLKYDEDGPIAHVLRTGEYYVMDDFQADSVNPVFKQYAAARGLRACIVLPIMKAGKTIGAYNLISGHTNLFDEGEIALLTEVTQDISFAIDAIEKERQRTQTKIKLRHSEQRLKQAQAIAHLGSWEFDFSANHLVCSEEYCKIYELAPGENTLTVESWFSLVHPDDLGYVTQIVKENEQYLKDSVFNYRILLKSGTIKHIHTQTNFEFNSAGVPVGIYGIVLDITDQQVANDKLIEVNRLFAFANQINHTVVHATDEQTLFNEVCRIAASVGQFNLACIDVVDQQGRKLDLIAQSNADPAELELFSSIAYAESGAIANVLLTGKPHIINDFAKEPEQIFWRQYSFSSDFQSSITLPLKKFGRTQYLLSLFSQKTNIFEKEELKLLEQAATNISFSLNAFEQQRHRSKMEHRLLQSETRLRQAQTIAKVGSWELDFATGVAEWSEEACKIYGLEAGDNIQSYQSWLSFMHPEDLEHVAAAIGEGQQTLNASAFYHRIIRRDNSIRHIYSQAEFLFDKEGKPTGMCGVAHDITEMRKAEQAHAQSEANLRMIVDLIPHGIFAKDYSGKFVFVNKSYAALHGVSPKDLIGRSAWERIPVKNESEKFQVEDQEVLLTGKTKITAEHFFTDRNGEIHFFHSIKVPFSIAGTNEKAVLCIIKDITEEKQAENDRMKMTNDIIRRNKDLEQFSYIVSHNLRAPVANIIGITNILQKIDIDEEQEKKLLLNLGISVEKLDDVIKDLNSILQIRNLDNERKEWVGFSGLLEDIRLSIESLLQQVDIEMISDFSAIDQMFTLKSYLYSVFFNLISNSVKYRRPDVPLIIEITSTMDKNKLGITFKDNGIGIDLEKKGGQVFGLYKRFHSHVEGKGMGLFMVKTQVETLGGTITIASQVNQGTEFRIEFEIATETMPNFF